MDARGPASKRALLSWLRRKPANDVGDSPIAAPPRVPEEPPFDPNAVGHLDLHHVGWMNDATGELAPGFAVSLGDVVVDVGAGDGNMAAFYAPRVRKTVLIDQDDAKLQAAAESLRRLGAKDVETVTADAAHLPIADGAADRVVCTEVLEHVDDPAAVLAELVRIGRPGALYLLSVPGAVSEELQKDVAAPAYFEKPNHIRIFSPEELPRLVEAAGLRVQRQEQHGFYWTMWWMLFWPARVDLGQPHPLLELWSRTWAELLKLEGGPKIKAAFDALAPKVNVVIARKAG